LDTVGPFLSAASRGAQSLTSSQALLVLPWRPLAPQNFSADFEQGPLFDALK